MTDVKIIDGEIFRDQRGQISSLNQFVFQGIERFYVIHHPDVSVKRGWHGHKHEKKWFYCIKGAFTLAFVKIDNWEDPSPDLKPEIFHLSEAKSQIVCVPEGHANWIKASSPDSILLVFSGKRLPEAYADSYRYDASWWIKPEDY